jgi:hypothetical protein
MTQENRLGHFPGVRVKPLCHLSTCHFYSHKPRAGASRFRPNPWRLFWERNRFIAPRQRGAELADGAEFGGKRCSAVAQHLARNYFLHSHTTVLLWSL